MKPPLVISLGGGLNSTAMCVLFHERGERPDLIMFADTGGERQYTYDYLFGPFAAYLDKIGFPPVTVVKGRVKGYETLEEECLGEPTLPSLAFGFRRCSDHWKKRPQQRYMKNEWELGKKAWAAGIKVVQCIGYDAEESHRRKIPDDKWWTYRYPLVEEGWGRDECQEALARAGLPRAKKSSCFFCPAMKKAEVVQLSKEDPELFQRAVDMEEKSASTHSLSGLGRHWSWKKLVSADDRQKRLFPDSPDQLCDCYDGGYEVPDGEGGTVEV